MSEHREDIDPDEAMRSAIATWVADRDEEAVMVLRYAVVAEVINSDGTGEEWLKTLTNAGMSSWVHLGMAEAGVEAARVGLHNGFVPEEEDEDD